jgi:hypothetical protein
MWVLDDNKRLLEFLVQHNCVGNTSLVSSIVGRNSVLHTETEEVDYLCGRNDSALSRAF